MRETYMALVWSRRLSNEIRELGYDLEKEQLVVAFPDGVREYYAPVSWDTYASIAHALNPARLVRQSIECKVLLITVTGYQ